MLRLGSGDSLIVFDGSGSEAHARILSTPGERLAVQVCQVEIPKREPSLSLTVGLSIIRQQAFEHAVQKLTELGVHAIVPLVAMRNIARMTDAKRWDRRHNRLQKIVIEASEQCDRTSIPSIAEPTPLADFFEHPGCVALVERQNATLIGNLELQKQLSLAVGPEGGWSPEELSLFQERRVQAVSLGALVLRSETAAIAAAATLIQRSNAGDV